MRTLKELYPFAPSRRFGSSFCVSDWAEECVFFVPDASTAIPVVFTTSLKAAAECTSTTQACAHFCSVLSCLFSGQGYIFRDILVEHGVNVEQINLPSMAQTCAITMQPGLKRPEMLMIFGQCFLILFKNVSIMDYAKFIKRAIEDMSIICGIVITTPLIAFTLERATTIYRFLGQDPRLKSLLMDVVLEKSESHTMLGKFMGYLSGMVAWNDMTALVYINDTLLTIKSPILRNPKVSMEVEALGEALEIVNQSQRPQFFAIYAKPNEMKVLETTKFPTLAAVANKLKADTNASSFQSISTGNVNKEVVDELIAIHNAWIDTWEVTSNAGILR